MSRTVRTTIALIVLAFLLTATPATLLASQPVAVEYTIFLPLFIEAGPTPCAGGTLPGCDQAPETP